MHNHPSSRTDAEAEIDAAIDAGIDAEVEVEEPVQPTAGPPPSNGVRPAAIESPAASATLAES